MQDDELVIDEIGAINPWTECGLSRLSKDEDFSDIDTDITDDPDYNKYDIFIIGW